MKCPLFSSWIKDTTHGQVKLYQSCLKEECAWWDEVEKGRCAILSLVGSLDEISMRLMHISEVMDSLTNLMAAITNKMPKDLAPRG